MAELTRPLNDGLVTIRPMAEGDASLLVAGRDAESRRFLGEGDPNPSPLAVITVAGEVVGWVDYDTERDWLEAGEVNVGYNVFASHRGRGYATRAVQLLMHHLCVAGAFATATLLISPENARSLALAARLAFEPHGDLGGPLYFKRSVPPLSYTDGVVTIRRPSVDDVDDHLASIDDVQIDWLWLPGNRESWEAMSAREQHEHTVRVLRRWHDGFDTGPKWSFAVDAADAPYVAYCDADLANPGVTHGEANISYSSHAAHRGQGHVSRAVRLVLQFLRDHTGAREAHITVDPRNVASLRVAASVGAIERDRFIDEHGKEMIRHVLSIRGQRA